VVQGRRHRARSSYRPDPPGRRELSGSPGRHAFNREAGRALQPSQHGSSRAVLEEAARRIPARVDAGCTPRAQVSRHGWGSVRQQVARRRISEPHASFWPRRSIPTTTIGGRSRITYQADRAMRPRECQSLGLRGGSYQSSSIRFGFRRPQTGRDPVDRPATVRRGPWL